MVSSSSSPQPWWKSPIVLETADTLVSRTPRETWPIVSGVAAFGSTLAVATFGQLKLLGVSTGTRPPMIPSTLGVVSVCAASVASHHAAMAAHRSLEDWKRTRHIRSVRNNESILTTLERQLPDNLRQYVPSDASTGSSKSLGPRSRKAMNEQIHLAGLVQIPMHTLRMYVQTDTTDI